MKTDKLVSGVECTYGKLTGKHQRILTENEGRNFKTAINDVLADVVKSIGDIVNPGPDFFKKTILHYDKTDLLVKVRMHSLNDDPEYHFDYKYDDDGEKKILPVDLKISYEAEVEQEDGTMKVETIVGCKTKPYPKQWNNYSEIDRFVRVTLPDSGIEVRFDIMDGTSSMELEMKTKKQKSSHTFIEIHHPVYFEKGSKKQDIPVQLTLDNLTYVDIEYLRKAIKESEAAVDTEMIIVNPSTNQDVLINIIGQMTFFFPSGAI